MNRSIRRMSATLAAFVFALLSLPAAHAQSTHPIGSVNVPFAFEFASHHFAPGHYRVTRIGDSIISINNGTDSMMGSTLPAINRKPSSSTQLVFLKLGDRYFLRDIHTAGAEVYAECLESKAEKQALTTLAASNRTKVETIEVAAVQ